MKKLLAIVIVFLLLCGCVQNAATTPVLNNISFIAEISYGESEYSADVSIRDDVLNLVVTAPKEIDGLSFKLDKNGIKANFKGIPFDLDTVSLPKGAVYQVLICVLDDAKQKTAISGDGNCKITGDVDGNKYMLLLSPSGLPIELEIKELDFQMKFTDVTVE